MCALFSFSSSALLRLYNIYIYVYTACSPYVYTHVNKQRWGIRCIGPSATRHPTVHNTVHTHIGHRVQSTHAQLHRQSSWYGMSASIQLPSIFVNIVYLAIAVFRQFVAKSKLVRYFPLWRRQRRWQRRRRRHSNRACTEFVVKHTLARDFEYFESNSYYERVRTNVNHRRMDGCWMRRT